MKKNKKDSLEEYVYEEIKSAIFQRKIPIKTQLNEEQLARAFKVSRTPIRSVLRRLHYEKIIKIIPNRGAFINKPTQKEIENTFHLRTVLEVESIKIACSTAKDSDLRELEALTHLEEKMYKKNTYDRGIRATSAFHQGLVALSGNEIMESYSRELINITSVYLAYHDHADKESPLCPNEHRDIIHAIRQGNVEKAVRVFLDHFKTVRRHLSYEQVNQEVSFSEIFNPYKEIEDLHYKKTTKQ